MSALENLAPDQRAVLQLVLQRGRSYDEIAQLLSIDRSAVRQRALDAFDALTPTTVLPGPEQALVTDYLLGQLPGRVAEEVYSFLEASEPDREWALALADVVRPLVPHSLPEIPVGGMGVIESADGLAAGVLEHDSDSPAAAAPVATPAAPVAVAPPPPPASVPSAPGPDRGQEVDSEHEARPSSRRGGALLLGVVGLLIAAAIVIAVTTSGGGGGGKQAAGTSQGAGRPVTSTGSTAPGTGSGTTGKTGTATTGTTPQILAQLNLKSPTGASSTIGIVEVIREGGVIGIAVDAQGVPANTAHNAYAVWLYNSPTSHRFIGFVPTLVGKNGKLTTEGRLPSDASSYHRLLITLETQSNPARPGEVVLSGPFSEHP